MSHTLTSDTVEGVARITEARLKREVSEGKIIDFRRSEVGVKGVHEVQQLQGGRGVGQALRLAPLCPPLGLLLDGPPRGGHLARSGSGSPPGGGGGGRVDVIVLEGPGARSDFNEDANAVEAGAEVYRGHCGLVPHQGRQHLARLKEYVRLVY